MPQLLLRRWKHHRRKFTGHTKHGQFSRRTHCHGGSGSSASFAGQCLGYSASGYSSLEPPPAGRSGYRGTDILTGSIFTRCCASELDEVLTTPEPYALFVDFGENALLFKLRVFVSDAERYHFVSSQLRSFIKPTRPTYRFKRSDLCTRFGG